MNRTSIAFSVLAVVTLTTIACSDNSKPRIEDARIRLPPPGMQMAVGYFQIENTSGQDLVLKGVSGDNFASVEMHETVQDQGVSRMREREQVALPAGSSTDFEPGGLHLMLFGITPGMDTRQDALLKLQLTRADGSELEVPVRFRFETAGVSSHAH